MKKPPPPVFESFVGSPRLPAGGFDETAIPSLNEQLARDTGRTADEDVIQAVAVHVRDGDGRALPGQLVRQQRLHVVIDERPYGVLVLQCPARIHRLEHRWSGGGGQGSGG